MEKQQSVRPVNLVIDEMTGRSPFLQGYHCGWSIWSRAHHTHFLPIPQIQSILMSPRLARLAHLLVRPGKMGKGIQPWVQLRTTKTATAAENSRINQRLFKTNSQRPHPTRALVIERPEARCVVCMSSINLSRRTDAVPVYRCMRPARESSQRKLRLSANNNRCSPFLSYSRSYSDRKRMTFRKSP